MRFERARDLSVKIGQPRLGEQQRPSARVGREVDHEHDGGPDGLRRGACGRGRLGGWAAGRVRRAAAHRSGDLRPRTGTIHSACGRGWPYAPRWPRARSRAARARAAARIGVALSLVCIELNMSCVPVAAAKRASSARAARRPPQVPRGRRRLSRLGRPPWQRPGEMRRALRERESHSHVRGLRGGGAPDCLRVDARGLEGGLPRLGLGSGLGRCKGCAG